VIAVLRILDFAWHRPEIVEVQRPTISELRQATTSGNISVAFERVTKTTGLVLPEVLDWAEWHLHLPGTASADDVGLWDIIRLNQLEVHQDQPAAAVAQMATEADVGVVHIVNDDGVPVGLFIPASVARRLPEATALRDFGGEIRRPLIVSDLATTIRLIESRMTEFHSESLNYSMPTLLICRAKPAHVVKQCPCTQHHAPCG
jgi:hypothetical protein